VSVKLLYVDGNERNQQQQIRQFEISLVSIFPKDDANDILTQP